MKAGFCQADITPEFQTTLVGCYRPDSRSQGVLDRLYAQALLFFTGDEYFCLIAVDSLGLTVELANIVRADVASVLGTDVRHVMLNFSHTHSAPEPTPNGLNGEAYFQLLRRRISECAGAARDRLVPCKAGWALSACNLGENRRPGGFLTDDRLGGLMVAEAAGGKPIAVCLRVAAHANVLMTKNDKISSDFFGPAREAMAERYGCPVMIFQGASGNLKPRGVDAVGGGDTSDLSRVAGILTESAATLRFAPRDIEDIRMFSREITLVCDVPSREEAEGIAGGAPGHDAREWLGACAELRESGVKTQSRAQEAQFFRLNEGCFCGVADEIFCELALEAKRRAGNPLLFLNGYTNGCGGYLPDAPERRKGGYEVLYSYFYFHKYHGHVMPFREEAADLIVDVAAREWLNVLSQSDRMK